MRSLTVALALLATPLAAEPVPDDVAARLDAVRITARGERAAPVEAVARINGGQSERIAPLHASELLDRLPGVWISRGSGQEQLTAIRSPVLAGVGACGAFLFLEDGVPLRPTAFCNVNQMAELPTELAGTVEVLRGPGSAVHGSNALHGVVDLRPRAIDDAGHMLRIEAGPHGSRRLFASAADGERWRADAVAADIGSFRVEEGYRQQKLVAQWRDDGLPGAPRLLLSAAALDQQTAGFVAGLDAYRDDRRSGNANPEAFRRGDALRLQGRWEWALAEASSLALVPYARRDSQRFLQHFNLGQPLEDNGSRSAGLQLLWNRGSDWRPQLGLDLEFARGELLELQPAPLTTGTPLQQAIRPAGRHYDYVVDTVLLAAFGQWQVDLAPRWRLDLGLRGEVHRFDYDNRMGEGNLREDGSACGFGGCLFSRPADRDDRFEAANGQLGLSYAVSADSVVVARLAHAFRVPQAGELYRLQRGQQVADLDTEQLEGIELGWRHSSVLDLAIDAYAYRKRNVILRDAQGFNLNDGRTRHRGIEASLGWRSERAWFGIDAAYAVQRYAFDRDAAGGEAIRRGNAIDTAPRWLGGARLGAAPRAGEVIELEWRHQGDYFLDAANSARYPGHDLLHLRWQRALDPRWTLAVRLMNLADRRYAERADFAFGQYRYFPGAGRELFVSLAWRGD